MTPSRGSPRCGGVELAGNLAGLLAMAALLGGCSEPTPREPDLEPLVLSMFEDGWSRGDVGAFSSTIADSVLFHYAGTPRRLSRDEMGEIVLRWREAFPDLRMDIEEMISEGDIVAARLTLSGTHEGPWRGAPPTGRRVSMALMMFFRFEDGRMVELWESDDQLGFQRQLGLAARP